MAYLKKIANRKYILLARFMIHSEKRSVTYLLNAYQLSCQCIYSSINYDANLNHYFKMYLKEKLLVKAFRH